MRLPHDRMRLPAVAMQLAPEATAWRGAATVAVYTVTMFVSAGLLFLIQPLFARMVLPLLGGSPSVWNTAVVFFQSVLLAGYLYAHATTRRFGVRRQALVHSVLILLPLVVLPIALPAGWSPPSDGNPIPWLLALLFVAVGLPFFVVSTTSPLLQTWFAHSGHRMAADPYFLYAASNAGSMLALLGYPLLMEPALRLSEQSHVWTAGYAVLVLLLLLCALSVRRAAGTDARATAPVAASPRLSAPRRLRWVLLAFVPSSLMLSTTTYLATNIAPIPLIWVIPLALYLLTFIIVFGGGRIVPRRMAERALPVVLVPQVILLCGRFTEPVAILLIPYLLTFFVAALVCHAALADDRPESDRLTEFFVWLSVGGVLGGAFNALLAPLLFSSVVEYPLVLVLLCALMPERRGPSRTALRLRSLLPALAPGIGIATLLIGLRLAERPTPPVLLALVFGAAMAVAYGFSRRPARFALAVAGVVAAGWLVIVPAEGRLLHAERSFFGIHRVLLDGGGGYHALAHGSTVHGRQSLDPTRRREPLTYYTTDGPAGQVFEAIDRAGGPRRIGVVGLGTGSLACYARPGEDWVYYEIDPAVVRIARDERYFTYLRDCTPDAAIVLGDARLSLARQTGVRYDLLILDAFSSDAPPTHLLTREALRVYLDALAPHGLLAFHISNKYLDLKPVVAALAADAGMAALAQDDLLVSSADVARGKSASRWAVLARSPDDLTSLEGDPRWRRLPAEPGVAVWTDDYSSILNLFVHR